jgi:ElaB/YqjD/DUF883 family membrane-anchored ribosome-binding protein
MGAIDLDKLGKERLVEELRAVLGDAEDMLRAVSRYGGEQLSNVSERFEQRVKLARLELEKAEIALMAKAKEAAKATDRYVHENPWKTVGIAGGVGLLIGMLISRR